MKEYKLISEYYAGKVAERSGQPYMKHIDEGMLLLQNMNASSECIKAFVIHPLVQGDADLAVNIDKLAVLNGRVVAFAMEYRRVANSYLAKDYVSPSDVVKLSPLREVNQMLLADKIQNLNDLTKFNKDLPNYGQLHAYFFNWLAALSAVLKNGSVNGKV